MTRAVSGLSRLAMALASSRRPLVFSEKDGGVSLERTRRKRRGATSPSLAGLPRRKTCMFFGPVSAKPWAIGGARCEYEFLLRAVAAVVRSDLCFFFARY